MAELNKIKPKRSAPNKKMLNFLLQIFEKILRICIMFSPVDIKGDCVVYRSQYAVGASGGNT